MTNEELISVIKKDSKFDMGTLLFSGRVNNLIAKHPYLSDEIAYCLFCHCRLIWDDTPESMTQKNELMLMLGDATYILTRFLTSHGWIFIETVNIYTPITTVYMECEI